MTDPFTSIIFFSTCWIEWSLLTLWGHKWRKHGLYLLAGETENRKTIYKKPIFNGGVCYREESSRSRDTPIGRWPCNFRGCSWRASPRRPEQSKVPRERKDGARRYQHSSKQMKRAEAQSKIMPGVWEESGDSKEPCVVGASMWETAAEVPVQAVTEIESCGPLSGLQLLLMCDEKCLGWHIGIHLSFSL